MSPRMACSFRIKTSARICWPAPDGAIRNGHPLRVTLGLVTEILELGPLLERSVTTLSGGERQRVALGRAICSGPRLLLLDEPFASLDLALRRKLLPFLRRIRSRVSDSHAVCVARPA